jgi:hypothetical protein
MPSEASSSDRHIVEPTFSHERFPKDAIELEAIPAPYGPRKADQVRNCRSQDIAAGEGDKELTRSGDFVDLSTLLGRMQTDEQEQCSRGDIPSLKPVFNPQYQPVSPQYPARPSNVEIFWPQDSK